MWGWRKCRPRIFLRFWCCNTISKKGSENLSKNRLRKNRIVVCMTDNEKAKLEQKMEALGVTNRESLARKLLLDGYIVNIDMKPIVELVRLVRINSNNINQMAKRANETGSVYENDVLELLAEVNKLKPLVNEAHKELLKLSEK